MKLGRICGAVTMVVVFGTAFAGCGGSGRAETKPAEHKAAQPKLAFSPSQADTVVRVAAKGFQFLGVPATVQGPKVFFEVTNEDPPGPDPHDFEVLKATSGDPPLGRIEPLAPGEKGALALELPPGNYIAWCQVKLVDTPHADLGMLSRFTVQ